MDVEREPVATVLLNWLDSDSGGVLHTAREVEGNQASNLRVPELDVMVPCPDFPQTSIEETRYVQSERLRVKLAKPVEKCKGNSQPSHYVKEQILTHLAFALEQLGLERHAAWYYCCKVIVQQGIATTNSALVVGGLP